MKLEGVWIFISHERMLIINDVDGQHLLRDYFMPGPKYMCKLFYSLHEPHGTGITIPHYNKKSEA